MSVTTEYEKILKKVRWESPSEYSSYRGDPMRFVVVLKPDGKVQFDINEPLVPGDAKSLGAFLVGLFED